MLWFKRPCECSEFSFGSDESFSDPVLLLLLFLLLDSLESLDIIVVDFWKVDKVGSRFVSIREHFKERFSHLKQLAPLLI